MDNTLLMGMAKRFCYGQGNVDGFSWIQGPGVAYVATEALPH